MKVRRYHIAMTGAGLGALGVTALAWGVWGVVPALAVGAALATLLAYGAYNRSIEVLWMPTPLENTRRLLALAQLKPGELIVDLGCGDGRLLIEAATRHGARGHGVEIDPVRVAIARLRVLLAGHRGDITIARGDVRDADLSDVDVVFLYLNPDVNAALRPKLERELARGSRVVSNCHEIAGWKATRVEPSTRPGETLWLYVLGQSDAS